MRRAILSLALLAASCTSTDPKATLAVANVETYWAVQKQVGDQLYIAATVRFELKNTGPQPLDYVLATATFKRKGFEQVDWGTAFELVTPPGKPLQPGQAIVYRLQSDTHYFSNGTPESMFDHPDFKDAFATLFLRVGPSPWVEFAKADVPRRIGSLAAAEAAATP
jgi:hypothetical protein